jgi:ankyrin repeat protein
MNIKIWISILFTTFTLTFSSLAYDEIHQAALDGNLEKVKALIEANPELISSKVSTNDTRYARYGYTPLLCAAENGHKDVVEFLLTNKADINSTSANGWTALHAAAYHGHKDVVEVLLSHKAKINAKDLDGYTPLHLAAGGRHKDIVELLLANKADVNAKSFRGETPLHLAILMKSNEIADLLRKNGGQE